VWKKKIIERKRERERRKDVKGIEKENRFPHDDDS
jgi:hypothetical protein